MEYVLILALAAWVWLQRQRINTLTRRIAALEIRIRALAAEREPLLLDTPLAPQAEQPLLLDTPLPKPSNDTEPKSGPTEPAPPGPWVAAAALAALYALFSYLLMRGSVGLALIVLTGASAAATALGATPASYLPPSWRSAKTLAASVALSISGVFLVWVWPLMAPEPAADIAAPAICAGTHIGLAAYAARNRWAHPAALAVNVVALVLGFAGYIRARANIAPLGDHYYAWALALAVAAAASALVARPSRHDRGLAAFAGATGAAGLIIIAALTRPYWPTPWAWAPLLSGAAGLAFLARESARSAADPTEDWAVTWWAGAASLMALLAMHALAAPALNSVAAATLALGLAFAFARTEWRVLVLTATATAALAVVHAASAGLPTVSVWGVAPPWPALASLALTAGLLFAAGRAIGDTSHAAEALTAAGWLAGLIGVNVALLGWISQDLFSFSALQGLALLAAGQAAAPVQNGKSGSIARWTGPIFTIAGLAYISLECGWRINPWWGEAPAPIVGAPFFNTLMLGFAAPALMGFAAAGRWYIAMPRFARACLLAASALAVAWLVLEVRRDFHAASMAAAPVALAEAVAYVAIALIVALTGRTRPDRIRFAALVRRSYLRVAGGEAPPPLQPPPPSGARRDRARRRR